jgi:protein-S-isoprenylcysteine O-methyltransferase Ste14
MDSFFIPLIAGFSCNLASAFTTAFSHRWGEKRGSLISVLLRDLFGIPVWAMGFVLASRMPSPAFFISTIVIKACGYALIAVGSVLIVAAIATIGRRAAQPRIRDALAHTGLYALIRHPIYAGTILEFAGIPLIIPTLAVSTCCVLGLCWLWLQTSLEEIDLVQRMPSYLDYMKTVPRFFPSPVRLKKVIFHEPNSNVAR